LNGTISNLSVSNNITFNDNVTVSNNISFSANNLAFRGSLNPTAPSIFSVNFTTPNNLILTNVGSTTLFESGSEPFIAKINAYQYTLITAVIGGGSVAKNPNQASYQSGTSVQLTATPLKGYKFSHWSGNVSGTSSPSSIRA
jgi:hypothetical protein